MRLHSRSLLVLALCAVPALPQENPGDVVLAGGPEPTRGPTSWPTGLYLLDRATGSSTLLRNQAPPLDLVSRVVADPWAADRFVVATFPYRQGRLTQAEILAVRARAGAVTRITPLYRAAQTGVLIEDLVVLGDDLFFQEGSDIRKLPLDGSSPASTAWQGRSHSWYHGIASDGRFLYTVRRFDHFTQDLVRLDPQSGAEQVLFPLSSNLTQLSVHRGVLVGRRSEPLPGIEYWDIDGGTLLSEVQFPAGLEYQRPIGVTVDRSTGDVLVSAVPPCMGGPTMGYRVRDRQNVTVLFQHGTDVYDVAVRTTDPIYNHGPVSRTYDGDEPRIGANSVPVVGNSGYRVTLESIADSPVVLIGGAHVPHAAGFPMSLAAWGAPGSHINFAPAATVLFVTGGHGRAEASLPIPAVPALRGAVVDFQWLVADPRANALGLATSQTGTVVVE